MTENVFRPSRRKNGKRVRCRVFSGHYNLARGAKVITVPLDTPDERIARKRLRDIIIEKQLEAEGMESPRVLREALRTPVAELLNDYHRYLESRQFSAGYVRDTVRRVQRMAGEIGWKTLADIRPDTFEVWFSGLKTSPKTNREYQLSVRAFLNWLVRIELLARNPLAKLKLVCSLGREVRPSRAYTEAELRALFAMDGKRTLFYEALFYTAGRKSEVGSLVWRDLVFKPEGLSMVLFRASTTKNKRERVVPLHPSFVRELLRLRLGNPEPDQRVFQHVPTRKQLLHDLSAAGIERSNSGGVVHFHAFRKTARTLAVAHGASERVCDEVLGHANPNRMGTRYTDPTGLPLQDWTKLPWFGRGSDVDALPDALKAAEKRSIDDVLAELVGLVNEAKNGPVSEGTPASAVALGNWSGRQDSNLRPPGPKPGALPG